MIDCSSSPLDPRYVQIAAVWAGRAAVRPDPRHILEPRPARHPSIPLHAYRSGIPSFLPPSGERSTQMPFPLVL